MKRNQLLWVVILLLLSVIINASAQDATTSKVPEDYKGVWVCGRAQIEMIRSDMGYLAVITWSGSYAERSIWHYTLMYDQEGGYLADEGTGVKSTVIYGTDGEEESNTANYTDGAARFRINDAGKLTWEDLSEDMGRDMEFEKVEFVGLFPTREQLVEDYFHVIGGYHQGVSGASLAEAQAAYKAYKFAFDHRIWNTDIPALRTAILDAWESMTDDERQAFDENFLSVVRLIDRCLDDWEGIEGIFTDAGIPSLMGELLQDTGAQVSWSTLVTHTLTMGNFEF